MVHSTNDWYDGNMGKLRKSLRNYFAGAGSICIGLSPSATYRSAINKTANQALNEDWNRLGSDMKRSIAQVTNRAEKQKSSKG